MQQTHPLNVLKFCPKCSSPHFKVAGERSIKCQQCGFHYFINAAAAAAALVTDEQGRLLLTTRGVEPNYGMLDLPGGFIDPGETAEEAVKRELKEELGMQVKEVNYFYSAPNEYIYAGFSVFTLDLAFKIVPVTISGLKAMDDILDYKFYAYQDIDFSLIPAPSIRLFVNQFFKND